MKMGVWTPLPHTIRSEPRMAAAVETVQKRGEGAGRDCGVQFAIDVLQEAERLGFEKTLIAARYLGPDLDPWMLASALAVNTKALELIVAVHPGMISPQVVAKMAASLDRISNGRAAINIVNGWYRDEFDLYAAEDWLDDGEDRHARMAEFMDVMVHLWSKDTSNFNGRFYQFENGRLPLTPLTRPHPPLYTGSLSPGGRDTIARLGDYWFAVAPDPSLTWRDFDEMSSQMAEEIGKLKAMAAGYGRTLGFGMAGHVIMARSEAEVEERVEDLRRYGEQSLMNKLVASSFRSGLVGTPETIAARLRRYEEIGISFTMLHFHPMIEGMRQFAREVMPLLDRG